METPRLVLESDVVVDFLRRSDPTVPLALDYYECFITAITVYELNAVPSLARQQAILEQLLAKVSIANLDTPASRSAANAWRTLATTGQLIGVLDLLTAGICLSNDLPLLTRNVDHFSRVDGLRLITPDSLQAHIEAAE